MRVLLALVVAVLVLAKAETTTAQVQVIEQGPFQEMLDAYARINRDDSRRLSGYRVQLISTTDRLRLEETKAKFDQQYPQYPSKWKHEPPYYKLRTGAFTDRARATTFLYRLKRHFPSAYPAVVRDIRPSELLLYR